MTVYCNSGFSSDLEDKNYYVVQFLDGLIYHFQDISFGDSIREIVHYMACGPESYLFSIGVGMTYGRRNRSLGSIFKISYNRVKELDGQALLEYISDELLLETSRLEKIKPKKFDLTAYKDSLKYYLDDSLQIILNGGSTSKGKVLNDDIQQAMLKKWSRL